MTLVETLIFSEILKNILSKFTNIMFSKSIIISRLILLFIVSIQYSIGIYIGIGMGEF